MKIITLSLSLMTTAVMACPDLSGLFQCFEEETGYYMAEITQKKKAGVTTYKSNSDGEVDLIIADNKWRDMSEDGEVSRRKAVCKGNTLGVQIQLQDSSAGEILIDINTIINSDQDMETAGTVTIMGQTFPTETSVCVRQ